MPALNEISPAKLMRLIGTTDCPVIVDVCLQDDIAADPHLLPTAFHHAHDDAAGLAQRLNGREVVVVCQKGKKLSHGVAAILRNQGIAARVLEGGNMAWRNAGLPRIPLSALRGSRWVTRHRPKIDRIACPWLIRRFVDRDAEFLFVPPAHVDDVAARFDATAFDTETPPFTHVGALCTFDAMVAHFGLAHPALDTLAQIVRAADTDRHDLSPQAAGLLAISVGLSRMHRSDTAQLEAGMAIYDALYRWARDGQDEGHDWPTGGTA